MSTEAKRFGSPSSRSLNLERLPRVVFFSAVVKNRKFCSAIGTQASILRSEGTIVLG